MRPEQVIAANPTVLHGVRANRAFLGRAVRYLAAEAGIRQFLDLGTGLPAAQNTHQVAQEIAPDARIVYVDNDPIVGNRWARARVAPSGQLPDRLRHGPRHRHRAGDRGTARLNQRIGPTQLTLRTLPDFERFFDGLEMAEPGSFRCRSGTGPVPGYPIPCYAGMGRKALAISSPLAGQLA
jgi:S-adenosyl methyltransferase